MISKGKTQKADLVLMVCRRLPMIVPWTKPVYAQSVHPRVSARSIFIRHVDCGSSNSAEQEIIALFNPIYNLEQFGFRLVASPRHADILLLTGPLTRAMKEPLLAAFRAMPEPRRVVTVGNGFDGDTFWGQSYTFLPLPEEILTAQVASVPGDPPSPEDLLKRLLELKIN